MQIELRPITSIRPYERNPRLNDAGVDAVARSLQEFGWRQPIVVDEEGVIVVGHTRYKAALKLGMTEVPVHVAIGLTPAQLQAYRIADNQTAAFSTWDDDKLTAELMDLQKQGYDLDLTGFEDDKISELLHDASGELGDPDAIPDQPDEATTQPGDLWIMGNHRLLCGNSSQVIDVDRLLDGATIQR
jgi:ParB-like chromosome segregation protein Spo0J